MAHIIVDRRKNDKGKSSVNRRKFVKRVKNHVKEAVKDVIRDGSIQDIVSNNNKKIRIPDKGLKEPSIHHDQGGVSDRVLPGNDEFTTGDRVPRPEGGGAGGGAGEGSPDGEGEDEFTFSLTRDEFLDIFFEDLELPDLVRKELAKTDEWAMKRAGFSVDGNPARLNVTRSMKQAKGRRFALRSPKLKKLKRLKAELKELELFIKVAQENGEDCTIEKDRKKVVEKAIKGLRRKIKAVPFIDEVDLRYNRWERVPIPTTQAVMFAIMDVSFSMGEWEKEMSKRFFMLLYLFLVRNYERVDIVFIRHHTTAKEVDEEEFFYSKESGGTIVSTALELMSSIMDDRYPTNQWNIFGCQCSDGDNWGQDSVAVQDLLNNKILPRCQYYAYVEIDQRGGKDSDLWPYLESVREANQNFDMTVITDVSEIYHVFRRLFEKRGTNE